MLGSNQFRINHTYKYSNLLVISTFLGFKNKERDIGLTFSKTFEKQKVTANLSMGANIPNGLSPPSLSFEFGQFSPVVLSLSAALGQGLGLSIEKDIDSKSNLGYKLDVQLGTQNMSISPTVMYEISKNIQMNASMNVDLEGTLTHSLGMLYKVGSGKNISLTFARNF